MTAMPMVTIVLLPACINLLNQQLHCTLCKIWICPLLPNSIKWWAQYFPPQWPPLKTSSDLINLTDVRLTLTRPNSFLSLWMFFEIIYRIFSWNVVKCHQLKCVIKYVHVTRWSCFKFCINIFVFRYNISGPKLSGNIITSPNTPSVGSR